MTRSDKGFYSQAVTGENINPQKSPRFTGIQTFMRSPLLHSTGEALSDVDIGIVGVPYDGGVTYRTGARLGPRAVREGSVLIRTVNHHTQIAPFDSSVVRDLGDVQFRNSQDMDSSIEDLTSFYTILKQADVTPLSVGGDHSISYPILKALAADGPVAMIHVDAHTDTMGPLYGAKFHHGAPFYHAAKEGLIDPKHCIQIGIRGSEHLGTENNSLAMGMRVVFIEEFVEIGVKGVIDEIQKTVGDMSCYFSFDVDGLDPVYASGTGTPEAGGLHMREAVDIIRGCRNLNFVGADLVEIAPMYDPTEVTTINAAALLFEITCLLSESIVSRR